MSDLMISQKDNIKVLEWLVRSQVQKEDEREQLSHSGLPAAFEDEKRTELDREIQKMRRQFEEHLERIELFPSRHVRHLPLLDNFWKDGNYSDSVFIMTKFPEGNGNMDKKLTALLDVIKDTVGVRGYIPRLASDKAYHPGLWDNVELYLLGCERGIAVVEDCYKKEFNPNVAKEWGWMRAMGRNVLFLIEKKFKHLRADWGGLLSEEFNWSTPDSAIKKAIEKWLPAKGAGP